ncbi:metallophosphoesterase [Stenotrophomonas sp. YAU14A_MKIMI4_1]|uniref:metallophosphoesterase n=1 Tax=Stenotrophomonas sp. YAU14A_MKIMI4_1 TaxID=2072408 RepID=UPI000D53E1E8|nr:metallophosphoesterase [Stenotrophomonas sp. YAU14A_MKIMI4_1]AWH28543.1 metallophosphoesterase [Stenotrophomonas sp. YAU14A_MKIMI4_1]
MLHRALSRPARLLLPLALLLGTPLLQAREVATPAEHVDADGPYVFRVGEQLRAQWICGDQVQMRTLPATASGTDFSPQCGYTHSVHVAPPAAPSVSVLPAAPRIVALSDIHGQYGLLVRLLRANKVIDAQDRWALGTDTLVIAGDVFDRGPQVTEAFWLLYGLQQQAAAAGGAVHFVLGNHETMVLYDDLRYVNAKYLRSAKLLGRSYPQLYGADSVIGQWLRTRPVLLKIGDTLFLHGGISPDAVALALDPAATNRAYQASLGTPKAEVKANPATAPLYDGKTSPIWYRGYFDGRLDAQGVQAVLDRLQLKRIVVGHTSMPHVSTFHGGRVIAIDSSIKNGENGELLFIENGTLSRGLLDGSRVPLAEGVPGVDG